MQKKLGEDVQQHTRAHGYAAQRRINGNQQQFLLEDGGPDAIRTRDLCLRRATLYPAELRVRWPFS